LIWLADTEHLADATFGAIPQHGATEASRCDNAKAIHAMGVRQG
jgi:hypothetical protein